MILSRLSLFLRHMLDLIILNRLSIPRSKHKVEVISSELIRLKCSIIEICGKQ